MHSWDLKSIVARLRLPFIVQILQVATDLSYRAKSRDSRFAPVYTSIDNALDSAIQYYVSTGRIVLRSAEEIK